MNNTETQDSRFEVLSFYGQVVSGFGWILVALGGILLCVGLLGLGKDALQTVLAIYSMAGGVVAGVIGLAVVAYGQLLRCIRAIEFNTRALRPQQWTESPQVAQSVREQVAPPDPQMDSKWRCLCGQVNSHEAAECPSCGRAPNAII